jgi:outer membrane protein OmpA-like peptidoglycan-associated protein
MAMSLFDSISQTITPSWIAQLGGAFGQPSGAVEKGLKGGTAALLGAIVNQSHDRGFMNQLFSLIQEPSVGEIIDSPERMLDQAWGRTPVPSLINRLQSLVFGNNGAVIDSLARHAGITPSTASSLMGVASALVLGYLGRLGRQEQLDASGLARRLAAEKSSIGAVVPSTLAPFTRLGVTRVGDRTLRKVVEPAARGIGRTSPWAPFAVVAAALLAAAGIWALSDWMRADRQPQVSSVRVPGAVGTGGYVTRRLPGRVELQFPSGSTEQRLLQYIEVASPSSTEAWFEFDRLEFETDSSRLRADSRYQLANMAAILKAYPNVRVKIGGYTDNTGDPAANLRLSQERANAVAAALRAHGITANRLEAEGYGGQHPIADNATDAGRARNRRVAIRVISK